ncbi:hypothetical protein HNY73_001117 [Argiope bruennichi]|uniref:Uncharacterized protein n=1 Tax=Argiope bruennichi TaxID=94029 RepID=A0A8T0G0A2_ARGBR|nr:hypothetical protein HNY73_001117 [Argiope bruennichi]
MDHFRSAPTTQSNNTPTPGLVPPRERREVGAVYQVQPPRRQAWIKRRVTEASSNPSFFILLQIDLGSHAPRNPGVMHEHESCWQELIPDPFPFCLTSVQRRALFFFQNGIRRAVDRFRNLIDFTFMKMLLKMTYWLFIRHDLRVINLYIHSDVLKLHQTISLLKLGFKATRIKSCTKRMMNFQF